MDEDHHVPEHPHHAHAHLSAASPVGMDIGAPAPAPPSSALPVPAEIPPPFYASRLPPCTWRMRPQFATWEVDHARFELKRQLGKGSYGAVAEAVDHLTGQRVAIKRIDNVFDVFENAKRIYREVCILRRMEHANVVKIVHLEAPRDLLAFSSVYIVFECMDTDFQKLTKDETQTLTLQHVRHFLYQTLLGMHYCHSARILHRDIKPANLLLTEACDLKICDFGLARSVDVEVEEEEDEDERDRLGVANPPEARSSAASAAAVAAGVASGSSSSSMVVSSAPVGGHEAHVARQMTRHVVTRWYRAPELPLYNDGVYTFAVDLWAVGCCYAEMLGMLDSGIEDSNFDRKALFPGGACYPMSKDRGGPRRDGKEKKDQLSVILDVLGSPSEDEMRRLRTDEARRYVHELKPARVASEDLGRRYPTAGAEALDLLRRMLRFNPEDRLSVRDAMAHPFLASVRQPQHELVRAGGAIHVRRASPATIKELFIEEIRHYNPNMCDIRLTNIIKTPTNL